jgi:cytoskeletal protein RodZ
VKTVKKLNLIVFILALTIFQFAGCAKEPAHAAKTTWQTTTSSAVSATSSAASTSSETSSSSAPAVSLPSCSSAVSSAVSETQTDTVSVTIDGSKGGGRTYNITVTLQDKDTVLTVLLRACGKNNSGKSNVSYTGSASSAFVTTIYGVANSGDSGWLYSVNNVMPDYSCGQYNTLKLGDQINWRFSLTGK